MKPFVDRAKLVVQAGSGGKGCISFRREKFVPRGGPDGGDGGRGGNVIFKVNSQLQTLIDFHYRHQFKADRGAHGKGANKTGKSGDDLIVHVPSGTIVIDADDDKQLVDLVDDGREFVVVRGGRGGRGNARFVSPTNQAPRTAEDGQEGEMRNLLLELKLIADVGLVGLPNAGKSTLLSRLSAAQPKIADYPFTTLFPNLGIVQYDEFTRFVMADIPGLIEGAHEGKGLGHQFLNHILRTRILVILIDSQSESVREVYDTLIDEMGQFSSKLLQKPRILAINKNDLFDNETMLDKVKQEFLDIPVCSISAVTGKGLPELLQIIIMQLKN